MMQRQRPTSPESEKNQTKHRSKQLSMQAHLEADSQKEAFNFQDPIRGAKGISTSH
ncbi:MAG TPA: hypothetical protein VLF17_00235 [Candidatus Nitrosotenuis sp.]|nr:hypothetical protein [Candidatus Nitrosotenuis sp.]